MLEAAEESRETGASADGYDSELRLGMGWLKHLLCQFTGIGSKGLVAGFDAAVPAHGLTVRPF